MEHKLQDYWKFTGGRNLEVDEMKLLYSLPPECLLYAQKEPEKMKLIT